MPRPSNSMKLYIKSVSLMIVALFPGVSLTIVADNSNMPTSYLDDESNVAMLSPVIQYSQNMSVRTGADPATEHLMQCTIFMSLTGEAAVNPKITHTSLSINQHPVAGQVMPQ